MSKQPTPLSYLAGLIDGEGYIGIKKSHRHDAVNPIYHERIQVRMVSPKAIRALADRLGGNYYRERAHVNNGRPLWCWQASDALAARILRRLVRWFKVKRDVAETVLRLRRLKAAREARRRGSPARRVMAPHLVWARERLYRRCKRLNKVGR